MQKKILAITLNIVLFGQIQSANHNSVLNKVSRHIPSNPIILEAGGHIGEDTERMAQFWPGGIIHTFEPSPTSYAALEKKTGSLCNVFRYQYALTDYIGTADFYLSPDNPGASSILPPADWFTLYTFEKEPITVNCTTIDEWAAKQNVDHIDFMWLDMEGNELKALLASPKLLKTVKVIYIELNNKEFRTGTPHYSTVKRWLESQGFKSHGETRAYHKGEWWQSDVLFVKSN